jgi:hypothetical protein
LSLYFILLFFYIFASRLCLSLSSCCLKP